MSPTREEIIHALESPDPNPIADAVADAITRYGEEFAAAVSAGKGFGGTIRLSEPISQTQAVAFELFVQQIKESMPQTKITFAKKA